MAERGDLVEAVRDVDDRHARRGERAHLREQPLRLVRAERGGRLVEEEDRGGAAEGAGGRDELLVADREVAEQRRGIGRDPDPLEERPRALAHLLPVEKPDPGERRLVAEIDVLGERQVRHQLELLPDHAQALLERVADRGEADGPPVEPELAGVGLEVAVEDADQRRLAGPVVADEPDDLARMDGDRHPPQRLDAAEALADSFGVDGRREAGHAAVVGRRSGHGARPTRCRARR